MNFVLGISGKIGSGKTTLAKGISERYEIPIVGFGNYVRKVAIQNNISIDRKSLQDLGESLINEDIKKFCSEVVVEGRWEGNSSLIIDGIRHIEVYEILKEIIYPLPFFLINVNTSDVNRRIRLDINDLTNIDSHPTEIAIQKALPNLADLQIDGNDTPNEIILYFNEWLNLMKKRKNI